MKIRICSMEGVDIVLDVTPDMTVDKLKLLAVGHLHDPTESAKTSLYHKLVQVSTSKLLNEEKTLTQESVQDNDELLLLKKRTPAPGGFESQASLPREEKKQAVTMEQIKKATENLPVAKQQKEDFHEPVPGVDFQAELKKILISLIEAAQKILCLNPEAAEIFKEAEEYIVEQTEGPPVDQTALKQLTDMGFSEAKAKKALKLNRMSPTESIQWLLDHMDELELDDSASAPAEAETNPSNPSPSKNNLTEGSSSQLSAPKKVANMLESFRAFRRKQFKPNQRALRNLTEMGFSESDVIDALRVSGNKEGDACEWLLSGNRVGADQDLEEGLDVDSPVYKAIMSNPVVQLGLNNPRSLLAFLHMLENPSNTQQWLSDPDTGPMLIQISRIYHAEKHAPKSTNNTNSQSVREAIANSTYGATGLSAHALGVPNSPYSGPSSAGSSSYSATNRSSGSSSRASRSSTDSRTLRGSRDSSSAHGSGAKKP